VKIAWFPANATSVLQPMDIGVVYIFKRHNRGLLMQSVILNVEADSHCFLLIGYLHYLFFNPEDGGSRFFRIGELLPVYMVSRPQGCDAIIFLKIYIVF
jgi:hypothetical protein